MNIPPHLQQNPNGPPPPVPPHLTPQQIAVIQGGGEDAQTMLQLITNTMGPNAALFAGTLLPNGGMGAELPPMLDAGAALNAEPALGIADDGVDDILAQLGPPPPFAPPDPPTDDTTDDSNSEVSSEDDSEELPDSDDDD